MNALQTIGAFCGYAAGVLTACLVLAWAVVLLVHQLQVVLA